MSEDVLRYVGRGWRAVEDWEADVLEKESWDRCLEEDFSDNEETRVYVKPNEDRLKCSILFLLDSRYHAADFCLHFPEGWLADPLTEGEPMQICPSFLTLSVHLGAEGVAGDLSENQHLLSSMTLAMAAGRGVEVREGIVRYPIFFGESFPRGIVPLPHCSSVLRYIQVYFYGRESLFSDSLQLSYRKKETCGFCPPSGVPTTRVRLIEAQDPYVTLSPNEWVDRLPWNHLVQGLFFHFISTLGQALVEEPLPVVDAVLLSFNHLDAMRFSRDRLVRIKNKGKKANGWLVPFSPDLGSTVRFRRWLRGQEATTEPIGIHFSRIDQVSIKIEISELEGGRTPLRILCCPLSRNVFYIENGRCGRIFST